jgi:hypothetical protein
MRSMGHSTNQHIAAEPDPAATVREADTGVHRFQI